MASLGEGPHTDSPAGGLSSSVMMPFIVSSGVNAAGSVTRKFIRSHVMRGKEHKKIRHGKPKKDNIATHTYKPPIKLEDVIKNCAQLCPGRINSGLSFIEFPEEIEP